VVGVTPAAVLPRGHQHGLGIGNGRMLGPPGQRGGPRARPRLAVQRRRPQVPVAAACCRRGRPRVERSRCAVTVPPVRGGGRFLGGFSDAAHDQGWQQGGQVPTAPSLPCTDAETGAGTNARAHPAPHSVRTHPGDFQAGPGVAGLNRCRAGTIARAGVEGSGELANRPLDAGASRPSPIRDNS
jgi:hypothetical protein